jgi:hypothetical protein
MACAIALHVVLTTIPQSLAAFFPLRTMRVVTRTGMNSSGLPTKYDTMKKVEVGIGIGIVLGTASNYLHDI